MLKKLELLKIKAMQTDLGGKIVSFIHYGAGAGENKDQNRRLFLAFTSSNNPELLFQHYLDNWGVICYWARVAQLPLPDLGLSLPLNPSSPYQMKFSFFKNVFESQISLHNSSIHKNEAVLFCISLIIWCYMAHFQFSL